MTSAWPIVWHDTVDSTNNVAKNLAAGGAKEAQWIAARQQTSGRGRLGRHWGSPPGNLYASAMIPNVPGLDEALRLPFAAALAVHDCASSFAPQADIALKWPNDVRVGGAKLSGILVESGREGEDIWAVVGIGINLATKPPDTGQAAVCLADLTLPVPDPTQAMVRLAEAFAARYWEAIDAFAATREAWCARAETGSMTTKQAGQSISGEFAGLAEDGSLRLQLDGGDVHIVRTGDVELVKRV